MNVYFFSRHEPQPAMIQDLGDSITRQFKGTISAITRKGDCIEFCESLDSIMAGHQIPVNSIVVVVAPLPLQEAWLRAGVEVLLLPQNNRTVGSNGEVVFNYSGLLQVLSIEVKTRQWAGRPATTGRDNLK